LGISKCNTTYQATQEIKLGKGLSSKNFKNYKKKCNLQRLPWRRWLCLPIYNLEKNAKIDKKWNFLLSLEKGQKGNVLGKGTFASF